MDKEIIEFNCPLCNFTTTNKTNWFRHNETNKHKRKGTLLPKKCSICDFEAKNHWNLKMHHAAKHTTLEERKNYKYYCDTCDIVFFCEAYFIKHNNGIHHKNMIKAIIYQSEINKIVEEKKNDIVISK